MPFFGMKIRPGINTVFTPILNEGGWSDSNLIRFNDGLPQKIGGWEKYWPFSIASAIRAMHAWLDLNSVQRLAVGSENTLGVITAGALSDITPQTKLTDFVPNITTTSASATVTITDAGISNVTTYDTVYFNTPISVGGLILAGAYPITLVTGATSYTITAASNATATVSTIAITGATQANPCVVTAVAHGRSNGDLVYIAGVAGMTQINGLIFTVAGVAANTFQLSGINSTAYTAYSSGGFVYGGIVPQLTTASGSASVTVTLPDHGLSVGGRITFPISTTVGGLAIVGTYSVVSVGSVDVFTVTAANTASSTATVAMNSGLAGLLYYIALGPAATGAGYGLGTYGTGTYGIGSAVTAQTGTAITADDWTIDNWGRTLLACPDGGGIYEWDPDGGFATARLVSTSSAPLCNTGIFISQPAQILVAYGSTTQTISGAIGGYQDPLLIRWSDQDDYTDWSIDLTDQVGSVRLPTGSRIVGGTQGPNQGLIWTDVSLWTMQYSGQPFVFGFNEVATGCGLIAKHAYAKLQNSVFWMGPANFYAMIGGVKSLPCTVWDDVFQDLDTTNQDKCWAWPVSSFDEVWFFYPSVQDGTGECSRYVKVDVTDGTWDKGVLARSAGIDQSTLDTPLAATVAGLIYAHESGNDADGQPINAYVETGEVMVADGSACMFVDQIRPDMKYGFVGQDGDANMTVTVTAINDITGAEMSSGALQYTENTTYLTPRVRGHRVKVRIESNDVGSWWRLGLMRYRGAQDGKI